MVKPEAWELSTPCNGFVREVDVVGDTVILSTPCNGFTDKLAHNDNLHSYSFQLHVMDSEERLLERGILAEVTFNSM